MAAFFLILLYIHLEGSKPPSPPSTEPETKVPKTERPTQQPTSLSTKPKPTQTSHGGPTGNDNIQYTDVLRTYIPACQIIVFFP